LTIYWSTNYIFLCVFLRIDRSFCSFRRLPDRLCSKVSIVEAYSAGLYFKTLLYYLAARELKLDVSQKPSREAY